MRRLSRRVALTALFLVSAAPLTYGQPLPEEDAAPRSSPGPLERAISALQRRGLFDGQRDPHDGLALRVGSVDGGSRLAIGPLWRHTVNGHLEIETSAAVSIKGDREVAAGLHFPGVLTHWAGLAFTASATELPEGNFYGLGPDSEPWYRTTFSSGRRSVRAAVIVRPAAPLAIEASTGLLSAHVRRLGGLEFAGADFDFLRSRLAVAFDNRDRRTNRRRGGRYSIAVERFAGPAREWTSFNRLETRLEQNVGVWRPGHTLTVRMMASFSDADEGHDVPFYLMPTLGGSNVMRGFDHERFRDRHQLVLQGEYAWEVTRTIGLIAFYERGAVAPRLSAFSWSSMRSDYGVGLRIGSPRFLTLRTDVAFGSGEGTRVALGVSRGF